MHLPRRALLATAGLGLAAWAWRHPAEAAAPAVFTPRSQLAIDGHDPVAYFTAGRPVRGLAEHSHEWRGIAWRFASAENLAAFQAEPERYTPHYGGYCAWAVAQGYRAPGNAPFWRIVDGRLYLNFDASVQRRWERDIPGFIAAADRNWPGVLTR
jgi:YHS domain-containing protein